MGKKIMPKKLPDDDDGNIRFWSGADGESALCIKTFSGYCYNARVVVLERRSLTNNVSLFQAQF